MHSQSTFIYALCEPNSRTVRYIGKSDNPQSRLREHLSSSSKRKTYLGCWLTKVLSSGLRPNLVILKEVPNTSWQETEKKYIRVARCLGFDLVNFADGGQGTSFYGSDNPAFGKHPKRTSETRARIGAAMLGKKLMPTHRNNISRGMRGFFRLPYKTLSKLPLFSDGEGI